jgi:predicted nucleotidyltransferase
MVWAIDVNMSLDCNSVINDLRGRLSRLINENYVAVLLFGSWARCEANERSDVDILVLHRGLNKINKLKRSRAIYLAITALLKDYPGFTVLDMDFEEFINPGIIRPLLLNIYWDALILFDRSGILRDFLAHVRRRIVESGLRRVRDGRAYYWILPKPMAEVRVL